MYSATDFIDAWVYHGFFRHLETYATTMFPRTYYGSRLGWIAPGYMAYHLFEPRVATVVLHLTFYGAAVSALYLIVRRVAGASNALFAAFAFGLYLPVVRALGSDYVDGAVITYALLAVALGAHGVEASSPWPTMASGAAVGAMLNSNVAAGMLLPSILVWLLPRRGGAPAKVLFLLAGSWIGGIILCTVVLVALSVAVGGEWAFFLDSFRWIGTYGLANSWDVTGISWIAMAPWVFLPVSTAAAALVWLLIPQHRDRLTTNTSKALVSLGLCLSLFAAWDFLGPGALLYWPFYASWLLPWTFIAIGALLAPPLSMRVSADLAVLALSAGAIALSLAWPGHTQPRFAGFAGLGLTAALLGFAAVPRPAVTGRAAVAAALVCLHGWLSATTFYIPVNDRADAFHAIDRGVRIMERYVTLNRPTFLLTPPKKLGHYVRGLTSVYLWGYTIVSDSFPNIIPEQAVQIRPGWKVVVISEEQDAAARFDDVFAPYGLRGRVRGSEHVDTAHGPLYLTFLETSSVQ
jgi:hypothetical protein